MQKNADIKPFVCVFYRHILVAILDSKQKEAVLKGKWQDGKHPGRTISFPD